MATRIRYDKSSDGKLVSSRNFRTLSGVREYSVIIDGKKFVVTNTLDNSVAAIADCTSIAIAKKKAKAALIDLGVSFEIETRTKEMVPIVPQV